MSGREKTMYKTILTVAAALTLAGCCSYSEFKTCPDKTPVDGRVPVSAYHVANISYKLVGLLPITSGETWKSGAFTEANTCGIAWFEDRCSLDDNLASVNHAAKTTGATGVRNLIGRYDTAWAWSFFLVKKTIVKTSCILEK